MDPQMLVQDPALLRAFIEMFMAAQASFVACEVAGFVVTASDGSLCLVRWPREMIAYHARSAEAVPAGTVAIVHTHPDSCPRPSRDDLAMAQKLELPVVVITRSSIVAANPDLKEERLLGVRWLNEARRVEIASGSPRTRR